MEEHWLQIFELMVRAGVPVLKIDEAYKKILKLLDLEDLFNYLEKEFTGIEYLYDQASLVRKKEIIQRLKEIVAEMRSLNDDYSLMVQFSTMSAILTRNGIV